MEKAILNHVAIVANGLLQPSAQITDRIRSFPFLIAADGGCNSCRALGVSPNLIIGDMDSVDKTTLEHYANVPHIRVPREKDETDLELALSYAFDNGAENATIFGGLGNRIDHTLGNLILLTRYPGKVFLESETERVVAINREIELSCAIGQTLSLFPLNGPAAGITTTGLKWALKEAALDKWRVGILNETTEKQIKICVKQGDLLCIVNF